MNQPPAASAYTDHFARDHLPPRELWPELRFDLPELQYPPRLNCVAMLVDEGARAHPERIAIRGAQEAWSYARLQHQVDRIAHVLRGPMQLEAGNRVLLRGANCPLMAACLLAVLKAGLIAVPTMPLLRARELGAIANKAQVNAVLCAESLRAELEAADLPVEARAKTLWFGGAGTAALEALTATQPAQFDAVDTAADDVCLISFTSGTTGIPKGTMHFHRDVMVICDCFPRSVLHSQRSDIFIGTPPLAFTFGLGGLLLFPLRVGATAVLLEKLTPETLLKAIETYRATVCFTAPTFYRQMAALAPQFDLASLQKSVSAGEALPLATRESWRQATGLNMIDGIAAHFHLRLGRPDTARRYRQTGAGLSGLHSGLAGQSGGSGRDRPAGGERPDRLPLPGRRTAARLCAEWLEPDRRRLRDGRRWLFLLPLPHR
jgi:2-aminobenzoate-CoA ligase